MSIRPELCPCLLLVWWKASVDTKQIRALFGFWRKQNHVQSKLWPVREVIPFIPNNHMKNSYYQCPWAPHEEGAREIIFLSFSIEGWEWLYECSLPRTIRLRNFSVFTSVLLSFSFIIIETRIACISQSLDSTLSTHLYLHPSNDKSEVSGVVFFRR